MEMVWLEIVQEMVRTQDYPHEWNEWIAMLAPKPGEELVNFERRRDLWLMPGSQKLLTRLVNMEYNEAKEQVVPGSQAGFEKGRNGAEHTLAMRLAAEQCMAERQPLYRGYLDEGTFFMSIANDVAFEVERRAGVAPQAVQVIRALREGVVSMGLPGLTGRYETAHGLTRAVRIQKGLGQGDLSSPTRSELIQAIMQKAINRLTKGFKYTGHGERVVIFQYADDAGFLTNDLGALQMAFDTAWMVARILGLTNGTNKEEEKERVERGNMGGRCGARRGREINCNAMWHGNTTASRKGTLQIPWDGDAGRVVRG